jgi:hypothetical protein
VSWRQGKARIGHESAPQRAVRRVAIAAGLNKRVTTHVTKSGPYRVKSPADRL